LCKSIKTLKKGGGNGFDGPRAKKEVQAAHLGVKNPGKQSTKGKSETHNGGGISLETWEDSEVGLRQNRIGQGNWTGKGRPGEGLLSEEFNYDTGRER